MKKFIRRIFYEKKCIVPILVVFSAITYVLITSNPEVVTSEEKTSEINWTIKTLANNMLSLDDKNIDFYFQDLDDDQVILAFEDGGFTTKSGYFRQDHDGIDPLVNTGKIQNGRPVLESLESEKTATVGEVKEALKAIKQ